MWSSLLTLTILSIISLTAAQLPNIPTPELTSVQISNDLKVVIRWTIATHPNVTGFSFTMVPRNPTSRRYGDVPSRNRRSSVVEAFFLTKGEHYTVFIQATSYGIPGAQSNSRTIVIAPETPGVDSVYVNGDNLEVVWSFPGTALVEQFAILAKSTDGGVEFTRMVPKSFGSVGGVFRQILIPITDLTRGKTYDVSVAAISNGARSPHSQTSRVTIPLAPQTPAPTTTTTQAPVIVPSITGVNQGALGNVQVRWSMTSTSGFNGFIVTLTPSSGGAEFVRSVSGSQRSLTISPGDIVPGESYIVTVQAMLDGVAHPESLPRVFNSRPETPSIESVTVSPTTNDVSITWFYDPAALVDSFYIWLLSNDGGLEFNTTVDQSVGRLAPGIRLYVVPGVSLSPGKRYDVTLAAMSHDVKSMFPLPYQIQTANIIQAVKPVLTSAEIQPDGNVLITWTMELTTLFNGFRVVLTTSAGQILPKNVAGNERDLTIPYYSIQAGESYTVYVQATLDGILLEKSNTMTFGKAPNIPRLENINVLTNNTLQIRWYYEENSLVDEFIIWANSTTGGVNYGTTVNKNIGVLTPEFREWYIPGESLTAGMEYEVTIAAVSHGSQSPFSAPRTVTLNVITITTTPAPPLFSIIANLTRAAQLPGGDVEVLWSVDETEGYTGWFITLSPFSGANVAETIMGSARRVRIPRILIKDAEIYTVTVQAMDRGFLHPPSNSLILKTRPVMPRVEAVMVDVLTNELEVIWFFDRDAKVDEFKIWAYSTDGGMNFTTIVRKTEGILSAGYRSYYIPGTSVSPAKTYEVTVAARVNGVQSAYALSKTTRTFNITVVPVSTVPTLLPPTTTAAPTTTQATQGPVVPVLTEARQNNRGNVKIAWTVNVTTGFNAFVVTMEPTSGGSNVVETVLGAARSTTIQVNVVAGERYTVYVQAMQNGEIYPEKSNTKILNTRPAIPRIEAVMVTMKNDLEIIFYFKPTDLVDKFEIFAKSTNGGVDFRTTVPESEGNVGGGYRQFNILGTQLTPTKTYDVTVAAVSNGVRSVWAIKETVTLGEEPTTQPPTTQPPTTQPPTTQPATTQPPTTQPPTTQPPTTQPPTTQPPMTQPPTTQPPTTQPPREPVVPVLVSATVTVSGGVKVTWMVTATSGFNGFFVTMVPQTGGINVVQTIMASARTLTIRNRDLRNGAVYAVYVQAMYNGVPYQKKSNIIIVNTRPAIPRIEAALQNMKGDLEVIWYFQPDELVDSFDIHATSTNGGVNYTTSVYESQGNVGAGYRQHDVAISNLTPGKTYTIRVAAVSNGVRSVWSLDKQVELRIRDTTTPAITTPGVTTPDITTPDAVNVNGTTVVGTTPGRTTWPTTHAQGTTQEFVLCNGTDCATTGVTSQQSSILVMIITTILSIGLLKYMRYV